MNFCDECNENYRMRNTFVKTNRTVPTRIKHVEVQKRIKSLYNAEGIDISFKESFNINNGVNGRKSESIKSFESSKTYDLESINRNSEDFHDHSKQDLTKLLVSDLCMNEITKRIIPRRKFDFSLNQLKTNKCDKSVNTIIFAKNQSTQCMVERDPCSMITIESLQSVVASARIFKRNQNPHSEVQNNIRFNDIELVDRSAKLYPSSTTIKSTRTLAGNGTYCKSMLNVYNQETIYNNLEKNARLQFLVERLIKARKRERKNELNKRLNGIQYLDRKLQQIENMRSQQLRMSTPEDNTRSSNIFPCEYNKTDQNLYQGHQDINNVLQDYPTKSKRYNINKYVSYRSVPFLVNKVTSITNFGFTNKNIKNNQTCSIPLQRNSIQNSQPECSKYRNYLIKTIPTNSSSSVVDKYQTNMYNSNEHQDMTNKEHIQEKNIQVSDKCEKLKDELIESKTNNTLSNIESKLDNLVESIYTLIDEVRSRKVSNCNSTCYSIYDKVENTNNKQNEDKTQSESCDLIKGDDMKTVTFENSNNQVNTVEEKVSKIVGNPFYINNLLKKIESDKISRDINCYIKKSNKRQSAVQITIDIQKKEIATEITDSLSRFMARLSGHNVTPKDIINIAVNTEPLGIFSLIKVSADTMRQLFSYVPILDYYSYLPQIINQARNTRACFVCNICGAPFDKPSQLGDHIGSHNLGVTRDCCVCRHVVDFEKYHIDLFRCKYCGQRFTRAYCCELHQETCAKRLGRKNDVTPSLMILT